MEGQDVQVGDRVSFPHPGVRRTGRFEGKVLGLGRGSELVDSLSPDQYKELIWSFGSYEARRAVLVDSGEWMRGSVLLTIDRARKVA